MDWNTLNYKRLDEFKTQEIFTLKDYKLPERKKINVSYELRKQLARLVKRPLPQIMGLTKGWTEYDLNGCIKDAEAFIKNPGARAWNIIKEINEKRKAN